MFVKVENLSFGYDLNNLVLQSVAFEVSRGKTFAILGGSGTGKSTLLKIISGLITKGKNNYFEAIISIDGKSPTNYRKSGKLGFMFQDPTLLSHLSVYENINLPYRIAGLNDSLYINSIIEKVGLSDSIKKLPNQLSGGMKTRVSLARSFVTKPELLLLDEPFAALDIGWKSKLYEDIYLLRKKNTTIILVTHDIDEAITLADEILVLSLSGTVIGRYLSTQITRKTVYDEIKEQIINDHSKYLFNYEAKS